MGNQSSGCGCYNDHRRRVPEPETVMYDERRMAAAPQKVFSRLGFLLSLK